METREKKFILLCNVLVSCICSFVIDWIVRPGKWQMTWQMVGQIVCTRTLWIFIFVFKKYFELFFNNICSSVVERTTMLTSNVFDMSVITIGIILYSKVIESPSDTTSLWREGVERIEPKARFFQLLHS